MYLKLKRSRKSLLRNQARVQANRRWGARARPRAAAAAIYKATSSNERRNSRAQRPPVRSPSRPRNNSSPKWAAPNPCRLCSNSNNRRRNKHTTSRRRRLKMQKIRNIKNLIEISLNERSSCGDQIQNPVLTADSKS